MHKYSLDKLLSVSLWDSFQKEALVFYPAREAGLYESHNGELTKVDERKENTINLPESIAQYYSDLEGDDFSIGLVIEAPDSKSLELMMPKVKSVLDQAINMDAQARSIPTKENYEEELTSIEISNDDVVFQYVSTTVNTSWLVCFTNDNGQWVFQEMGFA